MQTSGTALTATPSGGLRGWLRRDSVRRAVARPAALQPARPIVTFTFDGFPKSAARVGAALIENVGGRATFYASAAGAGQPGPSGPGFDAADVKRLLDAGHEIGCRTFSGLDCARVSVDAVFADMVRNANALAALGMDQRLISFAYPQGETTAALKAQLPSRFTSARGAAGGLASGKADLAQLRANAMSGPRALQRCLALLETARRKPGWVIFHAMDVGPRPSPSGVPSGLLERLCGAAFTGGMRILPMREALARALDESGG